jgi:hypothetical protein
VQEAFEIIPRRHINFLLSVYGGTWKLGARVGTHNDIEAKLQESGQWKDIPEPRQTVTSQLEWSQTI